MSVYRNLHIARATFYVWTTRYGSLVVCEVRMLSQRKEKIGRL